MKVIDRGYMGRLGIKVILGEGEKVNVILYGCLVWVFYVGIKVFDF